MEIPVKTASKLGRRCYPRTVLISGRSGGEVADMKSALAGHLCAALLTVGHAGGQDDFAAIRNEIQRLGRLTSAPAAYPAKISSNRSEPRALFFEGLPYQGKPTRVFARYRAPADRNSKVPGIVLVHGGGGTAFAEWVRKWNDHGFAAMSIAVEGQTDEPAPPVEKGRLHWKRHAWAGPARQGIYSDSSAPLADQWIYHAVANAILAHSLLRSFPEVDAGKVGLMGISWGAVIAATVAGIDHRLAFAILAYGSGAMGDVENHWGKALAENRLYRQVWDPVLWLPNAKMPLFWFTWLRDPHFPLSAQSASYRAAPGPRMVAVLPDVGHSHPAAWNQPDSYAFADAIVRRGRPWLRQLGLRRQGAEVSAEFSTDKPVDAATLWSATGAGYSGRRRWTATPADLERKEGGIRVRALLPPGSTAWFFNLRAGALTASSDFQEEYREP
jgi:dienelactone hydrolase